MAVAVAVVVVVVPNAVLGGAMTQSQSHAAHAAASRMTVCSDGAVAFASLGVVVVVVAVVEWL